MNLVERWKDVLAETSSEAIDALADRYPDDRSLYVSVDDVAAVDESLGRDIVRQPEQSHDYAEEAFHEMSVDGRDLPLGMANIRFTDLPDANSHAVGGFSPSQEMSGLLAVEGQITKRTEVDPKLKLGAWECVRCGTLTRVPQPPFGSIREPHECQGCEQRGPWKMNEQQSEWTDHQKVRLQQPPEEARGETESIDFHALDDLPGDSAIEGGKRVTVVGRLEPVYNGGNVVFNKRIVAQSVAAEETTFANLDTSAHADEIAHIREHPNTQRLLVDAFAPGHTGDEHIKLALLLQLFGGWHRTAPGGRYYRGDSHIYLLGDPGTDKTGLLKRTYELSPRAAITDGTGSSSAGLTASIGKDSFSDDQWSIDAGTLVRAHEGVAVVDELDKGKSSDLDALHTALESQEVHVSKAGKHAMLPAKTALLAAGNPTGGHIDPETEIAEQVDLQSPLLSRFDLMFVVREQTEESFVRPLAEGMVTDRTVAGKQARGDEVSASERNSFATDISDAGIVAYVSEAKSYSPVISNPAVKDDIVEWYTTLKTDLPNRYNPDQTNAGLDDLPALPVTARKIGAMMRLMESSARMRHSETIERVDFETAKPLIDRSLADIGIMPNDNAAFASVGSDVDAGEVGL